MWIDPETLPSLLSLTTNQDIVSSSVFCAKCGKGVDAVEYSNQRRADENGLMSNIRELKVSCHEETIRFRHTGQKWISINARYPTEGRANVD